MAPKRAAAEAGMGWGGGVVVNQGRAPGRSAGRMATARRKLRRRPARPRPTCQGGAQHHPREGDLEHRNGDKAGQGNGPQQGCSPWALEGFSADAPHSMQHDGGHRWFDAIEQTGHQGHIAIGHINAAERNQDEQRGQHKQRARHHATPGAVHQPADVGGELLGLGAGQQHAVVEGVQKALFGDPAFLLHQLAVHDGNLPRGPAKADEAQLEPELQGFAEGNGGRWRPHHSAPVMVSGFQLWGSSCASRHQA
jgi:hypothetical protein